ncbi:MAG: glycosyltransferase family 39 protein [Candidatus Shapirobacteria bacterium]
MVFSKFLKQNYLILTIIVIAAFLRLYRIGDYMEFLGDQGRDVVIVKDFLKKGDLFFIGPVTSIGNMYLGPFYYYFIAPALLLANFSPIGPAIFVAILSILTTYLIYIFTKKYFDDKTGLIAALLFAISPVVIKYSNFSWNPNIMPLFALLFIYCLDQKKYIYATLAFIMCLNSHYLALLLLFPAAYIILLDYKKFNIKNFVLPIIIFSLSLIPQLLFDLKHNGQNIKALATFFIKRETTVSIIPTKALPLLPAMFNQVTTRLLAGKIENFGIVVSIIFFALILLALYKIKNRFFYICLVWFFSGLIGLALYKQHIYDHYFAFIYPVIFILLAITLSKLNKYLTIFIVVMLAGLSIYSNQFQWEPPKQLATTKSIDKSILDKSNNMPFNFSLLAKMNYDPGYLYYLNENKNYYKLSDKITDQLFVVCEPFQIDCNPINNPEWGIAAFGWAKIDSQWEVNGIKVFKLVHNPTGI